MCNLKIKTEKNIYFQQALFSKHLARHFFQTIGMGTERIGNPPI